MYQLNHNTRNIKLNYEEKKGSHRTPYQHFQAQDHFESAPSKNWQSSICLNLECGPGVGIKKLLSYLYTSYVSACENPICIKDNILPHQSAELNHHLPFQIHT